ncbi:MAG: protein kinase [Isosphaeraceae bacterium]
MPRIPGYRMVGVIERGAMGVVYKAWQESVERYVAIKSVLPGVSHERFRREAKLIARIQSPHVVQIFDLQPLDDGGHAILMEYVDGIDLARVIKDRGGPLDEEKVLPWMRDVASGMCAAASARDPPGP